MCMCANAGKLWKEVMGILHVSECLEVEKIWCMVHMVAGRPWKEAVGCV